MAKASSEAAEAKEIEAQAIDCAKEAGAVACEDSAVKQALAEVEEFIMADVDKVAQEAGGSKGKEVFGDFGEEIGKERIHLVFNLTITRLDLDHSKLNQRPNNCTENKTNPPLQEAGLLEGRKVALDLGKGEKSIIFFQ